MSCFLLEVFFIYSFSVRWYRGAAVWAYPHMNFSAVISETEEAHEFGMALVGATAPRRDPDRRRAVQSEVAIESAMAVEGLLCGGR